MAHDTKSMAEKIWEAARDRFPVLSPEEQRAGIVILRELSHGEAVTRTQVARALGTPAHAAEALLGCSALSAFILADEAGRIQSFLGLSVTPTHHHLRVGERRLWAWCAFDALFLPELLGESATIESRDPESGQLVRLTVTPDHVGASEPDGIAVSMMRPEAWDISSAERIMASACHFIFFFASHTSGMRWQAAHPETVLLTLDESVMLAKRQNARLFGDQARTRGSNAPAG